MLWDLWRAGSARRLAAVLLMLFATLMAIWGALAVNFVLTITGVLR